MSKMQFFEVNLSSARTFEQRGQRALAQSSLSGALMNLLSVAVENNEDHEGAVKWLVDHGAASLLRQCHQSLISIITEVEAGRLPPSSFGGNAPHLVFAHLSWALDDFSVGESFVSIAERMDNRDLSTPFWCEYARGMGALVRGDRYDVGQFKKLRDLEVYWISYLDLIQAATHGSSLDDAIAKINEGFVERNSNKKIKDDVHETEGSARHPVKWDYRRDSLLSYIRRARNGSK
jgi:hypothetical protein